MTDLSIIIFAFGSGVLVGMAIIYNVGLSAGKTIARKILAEVKND
jgi:membrane protein DedA with SNARE-associated domain